jgi:uncharacterized protein (DUF1501 family)
MLDLIASRPLARNCDGSSRRDFLKIGTLGLATGSTLPHLLRARAAARESGPPQKKTSVILLFLAGGASQFETFDPKPEAPKEYRCVFDSTATTLPGVQFCSLLPRMARLTDKLAIVRSFTHKDGAHGGAVHWVKTGYSFSPEFFDKNVDAFLQQKPSIGSIVARSRGAVNPRTGVPTYALMNFDNEPQVVSGLLKDRADWLGQAYGPFVCGGSRNAMLNNLSLTISPQRLADRRALLHGLDHVDRAIDQSGVMQGLDSFQQQALGVLQGKVKQALDLTREPEKLRERYGAALVGQELLLARRLCEAGAGFVTIHNNGWDHHDNLIPGCRKLCPPLDQAVSAFIEDVQQRGLTDEILLVITGEFGRNPRIDQQSVGRNHWPGTNTIVFAGGGLKMGQVIGESDNRGAYPKTRPIGPQDLMATIFHVLGIDQKVQFVHPNGRPTYMNEEGQVIEELA